MPRAVHPDALEGRAPRHGRSRLPRLLARRRGLPSGAHLALRGERAAARAPRDPGGLRAHLPIRWHLQAARWLSAQLRRRPRARQPAMGLLVAALAAGAAGPCRLRGAQPDGLGHGDRGRGAHAHPADSLSRRRDHRAHVRAHRHADTARTALRARHPRRGALLPSRQSRSAARPCALLVGARHRRARTTRSAG